MHGNDAALCANLKPREFFESGASHRFQKILYKNRIAMQSAATLILGFVYL
jgi:hypothetical protein